MDNAYALPTAPTFAHKLHSLPPLPETLDLRYKIYRDDNHSGAEGVCRQIGVSAARYYTWKTKYADLGVTELRRLKMLEDENSRLKRIVADLTLDKQILQEVIQKSSEG